jgi:hypothetical protein
LFLVVMESSRLEVIVVEVDICGAEGENVRAGGCARRWCGNANGSAPLLRGLSQIDVVKWDAWRSNTH